MRQPAQFASGFFVHAVLVLILAAILPGPLPERPPATPGGAKPLIWTTYAGQNGGGRGGDGAKAAVATRPRVAARAAPQFTLPQMPDVLGVLELPGAVVMAAGAPNPGTNDGSIRAGRGEGLAGPGAGLGQRTGAGAGDGPLTDGTPGLTSPQVVVERRPEYTVEAMSARIQGAVLLEATVLADGNVGTVRILRAIDRSYGLDHKAIEAVRGWRFKPGTYQGKPVAVRVLIEVMFSLREP